MPAVIALIDVPAQCGRAADFDGVHYPRLLRREGGPIRIAIGRSIGAKDVCDFQMGFAHVDQVDRLSGKASNGLVVC